MCEHTEAGQSIATSWTFNIYICNTYLLVWFLWLKPWVYVTYVCTLEMLVVGSALESSASEQHQTFGSNYVTIWYCGPKFPVLNLLTAIRKALPFRSWGQQRSTGGENVTYIYSGNACSGVCVWAVRIRAASEFWFRFCYSLDCRSRSTL